MIRKLKRKFLLLAGLSLLSLLAIIVGSVSAINYRSVVREADEVLSLLSHNKGTFPSLEPLPEPDTGGMPQGESGRLPPHMSPELPYESRYFSVELDDTLRVLHVDTRRIIAVDDDTAASMARDVLDAGRTQGFADGFRFAVGREGETTRVIFLDRGRQLEAFRGFVLTSAAIALCGFAAVFLLLFFLAGRILRPIAESYEKQKRFITDAGHELKTPLTVIRANVDILEMELGEENESLCDIRSQTERLAALTGDLVSLSRLEEGGVLPMIEFPLSEVVQESADSFVALARTRGKPLSLRIEPMLTMHGNATAISQLVSILLDNALKYGATGEGISLELARRGRTLTLSVRNRVSVPLTPEQLRHVFDRFYRTDASRSAESGGHGVGLSIAHAVTEAHGGRIRAISPTEGEFCVIAEFFQQKAVF